MWQAGDNQIATRAIVVGDYDFLLFAVTPFSAG